MKDWTKIPGWLTRREGAELQRLAAGQLVLEIGALVGRSTACLARTAAAVVSVDPHDALTVRRGSAWHGNQTLAQCEQNLNAAGVARNVTLVKARIQDVAPLLQPVFGLVFVDGDHSEAACARDLQIAYRLINHYGTVAVHDYYVDHRKFPGVGTAVDRWREGMTPRVIDSLAVFQFDALDL